MARCQCGGGGCNCVIVAGENTTVTGGGSTANPYVVSAQVDCSDVRPCISAGPGATYDPATGVVGAHVSTDAGNNLVLDPSGGLYVPTGAATVSTGCGLTGDGSASAPVRARTGTWDFPCDLDANAGRVFCDSSGVLRSEPRGRTFFQQQSTTDNNPNTPVPAVYPTQIADHSLTFTNPDSCREMYVICETELDIDFDLPPGSGAAWGIVGDEQGRLSNTGSSTQFDVHAQLTKVFRLTVGPGQTFTQHLYVQAGTGFGGAQYNKVQSFIRAFGIIL
ncbi:MULTISPECIES: hypothetical protein [Streptomyces]|uniref:Uncharacterized protein n=1 Tax=Streptomyces canarius TaxID=285453 RepID=A0ABQ3CJ29_9ACTN|nr:hypothetical protein [Streptomyces canarius]GHA09220.1 hypothetical protein GCM10010345_12080 [Streptomyces canarius]